MNEIVKPNTATANAETLFDLKIKVDAVVSDVDTLFGLLADATTLGTTNVAQLATPAVEEKTFELSPTDRKRAEEWEGQWMTLSMVQYFLGSKNRNSAGTFLWRLEKSGEYEVKVVKLFPGKSREKMYQIGKVAS